MDEREYHKKLAWSIVRAMPLAMLGFLLCLTVIALPIGIFLIILSVRGPSRVMRRYVDSVVQEAARDKPLWTLEERPPPWLLDE